MKENFVACAVEAWLRGMEKMGLYPNEVVKKGIESWLDFFMNGEGGGSVDYGSREILV